MVNLLFLHHSLGNRGIASVRRLTVKEAAEKAAEKAETKVTHTLTISLDFNLHLLSLYLKAESLFLKISLLFCCMVCNADFKRTFCRTRGRKRTRRRRRGSLD